MKTLFFVTLFATFFVVCSDNSVNPTTLTDIQEESIFKENQTFNFGSGNERCDIIIYQGRIGHDFDSALDSLKRRYEPILNEMENVGHYSGEGYVINPEVVTNVVNFNYDDREFTYLVFVDSANEYQWLFTNDVLDNNGNHYVYVISCPD